MHSFYGTECLCLPRVDISEASWNVVRITTNYEVALVVI